MNEDKLLSWIYGLSTAIATVMGVIAYLHHTTFIIDASFGILIMSLAYYYRKKVIYSWEGALFSCLGFVSNTAGAVGIYELSYRGAGWDKMLHIISSIGISLLTYSFLVAKNNSKKRKILSTLGLAAITLLIVQGLGAVNEITEFIGSRYFGIAQGMFGMTNGLNPPNSDFERYDIQWDIIANLFGAIIGIAYIIVKSKFVNQKKTQLTG